MNNDTFLNDFIDVVIFWVSVFGGIFLGTLWKEKTLPVWQLCVVSVVFAVTLCCIKFLNVGATNRKNKR